MYDRPIVGLQVLECFLAFNSSIKNYMLNIKRGIKGMKSLKLIAIINFFNI